MEVFIIDIDPLATPRFYDFSSYIQGSEMQAHFPFLLSHCYLEWSLGQRLRFFVQEWLLVTCFSTLVNVSAMKLMSLKESKNLSIFFSKQDLLHWAFVPNLAISASFKCSVDESRQG